MTSRKPTPEGSVQRAIIDYLRACKLGHVRRVNAGVAKVGNAPTHPWQKDTRYHIQLAEPGHSDLVVELDASQAVPEQFRGRNLYLEVKAPGNKPTDLQHAFLNRQRVRGCPAFWACSVCEVHQELVRLGFQGLPVPRGGLQVASKAPLRTNPSGGTR